MAQREHSRVELQRKLTRHLRSAARAAGAGEGVGTGADAVDATDATDAISAPEELDDDAIATQVEAVLDWLEANNYLSAERFVESRINARAGRYGNLRIRQELQQHALSVPADLAQTLGASEVERARAVRARRFAQAPADAAERARQARFLIGRGFSADAVRAALREPDGAQS